MHASTILLALALVPIAVQGTPPQRPPAPAKPPAQERGTTQWPWGNAREAQRIERDFLGAWELVRADLGGFTYSGADCHGFLIAQPGYCSFQARLVDRGEDDPKLLFPGFTAGTYRWNYDGVRLRMVLDTLLGADDLASGDGVFRFERAGFRREYEIDLTAQDLTLERGNESRLTFRRLTPPPDANPPAPEPVDPRDPKAEPRGGR